MGDVLLATPFLRQLRTRFPDARVDMLVDARFSEIIRHNPHLTNVLEYSRTSSKEEHRRQKQDIQATLPDGRYDAVLDLQANRRSAQFRAGLGRKHHILSLDKQYAHKLALVHLKWNRYDEIVPQAERYRQTAQIFDVQDDGQGLELWLPEELGVLYPPEHTLARMQQSHLAEKIRIAIAPGAHHATKRWLPERFAQTAMQLADKLSHYRAIEVVLLGGMADVSLCAAVRASIKSEYEVQDCSGATSIFDTARELDTCSLLVCNDTGVMHIAAARRVPVMAVFGSTVREFGFAPYRVANAVVEADRAEVQCRPCTHIGRNACPKGHFNCMNLVTTEQVVNAGLRVLSSRNS